MTDAEFMLEYAHRKQQSLLGRTVHDGNREQITEEYAIANALEALANLGCRCRPEVTDELCRRCQALRKFREAMDSDHAGG